MKESEVQTILHRLSEFKNYYNLMNENCDIPFDLSRLSGLDRDLARLKEFVIDEKRFNLAPELARYREMFLYSLTKFNLNTAATRLFETSYEQLKIIDEWCKRAAGIHEEDFDDYAYTDNGFKDINGDFIEFEFCVGEQDKMQDEKDDDFSADDVHKVPTKIKWTENLRSFFYEPEKYLQTLVGLSDKDVAAEINTWVKRQKTGEEKIFKKRPDNRGNKKIFCEALKENELIEQQANSFRNSI